MRCLAIGIAVAIFWLASLLAALTPWVPLLTSPENTLASNGRWLSFKNQLEKVVFGADSYLTGSQALAENRLNLHPWHGFEEVLWRAKMHPLEVDFRFMLGASSQLSFVFNRSLDAFSGVRFSTRPDIAPARFIADGTGEFTRKDPLPRVELTPEIWHDCSVHFDGAQVAVLLDGAEYCAFEEAPVQDSWFGFKGGAKFAAVDDVVIRAPDGRVFRESFDMSRRYPAAFLKIALWAAPIELLLALLLWAWFRSPRKCISWLCAVHLWVAAAGITLCWFNYAIYAKHYPHIGAKIRQGEAYRLRAGLKTIRETIRNRHAIEKEQGVTRILFLGSSQTWGAGALRSEESFVNRIQRMLDENAEDRRFECINGAVPGATSTELLECFSEDWADLKPDLVVVNLSCNDRVPGIFEKNLREIAAICRNRGFRLVFVLEAVCSEAPPDNEPEREVMRRTAAEVGLPLLDADRFLAERLDTGFTFWDVAHATSYGHRLLAEFLTPAIRAELENPPPGQ